MDLTKTINKTALVVGKYSPEILLGAGLVAGGLAIFSAIKYGMHIERNGTLHLAANRLAELRKDQDDPEYSAERQKVIFNTAKQLAAPAVPMLTATIVSAACLAASFKIVNGRYVATAAALSSVTQAYANYREAVGKGVLPSYPGAVMAKDGSHATISEKDMNDQLETEMAEAGLEPRRLRHTGTGFGFLWDKFSCHYRSGDKAANAYHIMAVEKHLNQLLVGRGHVFLNELQDMFDVQRTPEGAIMGWVRTKDNPDVVIRLFPIDSANETIIESNVQGVIYKLI